MSWHVGPPQADGALPTLFYLCSSGEESLTTDPYNQPVHYLSKVPLRVFSFTLPCHGPGDDHADGIPFWARAIAQNQDPLSSFFEQAVRTVEELIQEGWVDPTHLAAAGLSRGAFAALHLAAREPRIHSILGYAPMTDLRALKSFQNLQDNLIVAALGLDRHLNSLCNRAHRYYIGNRDLRVSTDHCYGWVRQLTECAYQQGKRSPPIELFISPSIGHKGHGTAPDIFQQGAAWIQKRLGLEQPLS